jgi:Tfp pilus assembly protein FimT
MRHVTHPRAFTLTELVLVLMTIGIVTAIAAPRYARSLASYRVRCAAQRVVEDLALAAADARAASTARTVTFNAAAHGYTINGISGIDRTAAWTVRLRDEPYVSTIASVDLGGDASIAFSGHGTPDSGGTIVLRSGDFTRTVTIDGSSGRASVQ